MKESESKYCLHNILAIDIGGTLTKVALSCSNDIPKQVLSALSNKQLIHLEISQEKMEKLTILLVIFYKLEEFFMFLETHLFNNIQNLKLIATGGGALKYKHKFTELLSKANSLNKIYQFKVQMNEFETIISTMELFIKNKFHLKLIKGENTMNQLVNQGKQGQQNKLKVPLILANIGSGMSVLKLHLNQNKNLEFTRIGGSALGGGFLVGLEKIINQKFSFQNFSCKSLKQDQTQILKSCVVNISQIISLYSDIHQVDNILVTGGMVKGDIIRNLFLENLLQKNVFFTQIDGLLSVVGIVFMEWKKLPKAQ